MPTAPPETATESGTVSGPAELEAHLRQVVEWAREGRRQQPLGRLWDAAEEAAVAVLRSADPAAEARRRLTELLREAASLRAALRRYLRERRGIPWTEPPSPTGGPPPVQLDLFAPPRQDPGPANADAPRPSGGSLGALVGVDEEDAAILQGLTDMASGRWADRWQGRTLEPWLRPLDGALLVRARIWAEVWQRSLDAASS